MDFRKSPSISGYRGEARLARVANQRATRLVTWLLTANHRSGSARARRASPLHAGSGFEL